MSPEREEDKVSYRVTQLPAWRELPDHRVQGRGPHAELEGLARLRKGRSGFREAEGSVGTGSVLGNRKYTERELQKCTK